MAYAPIEDHAAIGDGRTVALIDRQGCIDWLPLPSLDAPPVFASLLDDVDGGCIRLEPVAEYRMRRRYLPGTNVLETTYTTDHGTVRVTDALVTGVAGRLPWAELARDVAGLEGTVTMRWSVTPGTAFGTRSPWISDPERCVMRIGDLTVGVVSDNAGPTRGLDEGPAGAVGGTFRTHEGSQHIVVVTATDHEPLHLPDPEKARDGIARTIRSWRQWSEEFAYEGPWRGDVQRSALALKLLIHSPTGAVAAAATTSLPESGDGQKNWDYRFAWVRDLAYTVGALVSFGLREETHAGLSWLLRTIKENGPEIAVFYTLDGRSGDDVEVEEQRAPGWNGIGPVVTGNPAQGQLQLGVYGDLFGIVRGYLREAHGNVLDTETGRFLADVADRVCDNWRKPDAGMWELPDEQHYTSSKMGCWQALDAAIWLAEHDQIVDRADRWREEQTRIRDFIEAECWSESEGAYVMYPGSSALDASVLLHAPSGYDRGHRMSSTIDAVRDQLGSNRRLFRYSGLREIEHPFVACGFWLAAALSCVGRADEATELMDVLVKDTNDVGLLAEMVDDGPDGQLVHWGNTPQALSHLALINAAITIREMTGTT
jgi:GH15 family glucan-1,4-alpha-glucosidase